MPFQTDPGNTSLNSWNLWDTRFPAGEGVYTLQTDGNGDQYCVVTNTVTEECQTEN